MIEDLYRQVILAHYRQPANRHPLESANLTGYAHNPLCGDELTVYGQVEDDHLADASFEARGCSIVYASADMMIDAVRGQPLDEVARQIDAFESMLEGPDEEPSVSLGDLRVLREVRKFPIRIKCALLPWRTLREALLQSRPRK